MGTFDPNRWPIKNSIRVAFFFFYGDLFQLWVAAESLKTEVESPVVRV